MNKLLLTSAIALLASAAVYAQSTVATDVQAVTESNAVDHAQPRPDSTVTAKITTETQTTVENVQDGKVLTSVTDTTITPSVDKTQIQAPVKALPAAAITDSSLDLEQTMKRMGKNFKLLHKADSLADMAAPSQDLAVWASQAEALGLKEVNGQAPTDEQKQKFTQGMQTLRKQIADLEVAIESNDADGVKAAMNEINDTRKQNHKFFDVD